MKKRFSDEQIISILREAEAGVSVLLSPTMSDSQTGRNGKQVAMMKK